MTTDGENGPTLISLCAASEFIWLEREDSRTLALRQKATKTDIGAHILEGIAGF